MTVTEEDIRKAIATIKEIFAKAKGPRVAFYLRAHPGEVLTEIEKEVLQVLINL